MEDNCNNLEEELFDGILTLLGETFLPVDDLTDALHRPFDVGTFPFLENSTALPLLSPRSVEREVEELEGFLRQLVSQRITFYFDNSKVSRELLLIICHYFRQLKVISPRQKPRQPRLFSN